MSNTKQIQSEIDDNGLRYWGGGRVYNENGNLETGKHLIVAGNATITGTITLTGAAAFSSLTVGGGYGDTGVSISAAGVLQADGAATIDGALTAASIVCTAGATFGGGYSAGTGGSGATISTSGAVSANGVGIFETGLTLGSNGVLGQTGTFAIKDGTNPGTNTVSIPGATGIITLKGGATIDNHTSSTVLNLTEATVRVTGAFDVTGNSTLVGADLAKTLSSQTTENTDLTVALTSDSTYLAGTNITYSGGIGSSALKVTGNYSGINGGYSNLHSIVNSLGAQTTGVGGVVAIKSVINNTVAQTAGNFTAVQGIAKHNHATLKMPNAAPAIGVEGVANQSAAGQIGTAIGVSAAYHIPADAAVFDGGAVWRGLQITCDNASANLPSEETGLAIWNMAGTQTNGIKLIKTGSGFTNDIVLQNGEVIKNSSDGIIDLTATTVACSGDLAAASLTVGGGYGATGVTITSAGITSIDGNTTIDADLGVTGNITVDGVVSQNTEGNVVINTLHTVTTAEINAGHTLVTIPATRSFRLVSCKAIAYGGAVGATTTVDILDGATKLVAYAQASLTQSAVLTDGGTGAAVLADGASYTACAAGNDITIGKTGADVTTATGVKVILSYVLE